MAAGMYLLIMWGYTTLQTPQVFAAFVAFILSVALVFWVSEARTTEPKQSLVDTAQPEEFVEPHPQIDSGVPSVEASMERLDSLKAELMQQYAQFGRDQSLMNGKGLGTWHHGKRDGEP